MYALISALILNDATAAKLTELLTRAWHRIPSWSGIRPAIYVNRTVAEWFDIQRQNKVSLGGGLTYENVDGRWVNSFRGIPIRTCDQMIEAEALVA